MEDIRKQMQAQVSSATKNRGCISIPGYNGNGSPMAPSNFPPKEYLQPAAKKDDKRMHQKPVR